MPEVKFTLSDITRDLAAGFNEMSRPMASAATKAVNVAGEQLKTKGRASIGSAGFSRRTQNTWRVNYYPKGKESIEAAAFAFWKLPYGRIFEEGGTIIGKPLLWRPMSNLPLRIGRGKPTPRGLMQRGVKLFSLELRGRPFLAANVRVPKESASAPVRSVTLAQLRQGSRKRKAKAYGEATDVLKAVPLFFGMRNVTLRKRTNLAEIASGERAKLGAYYNEALKV